MSTLTQFFGGSSGAQFAQMRITNTSGSFTVPWDGKYLITGIGGGGSGGGGSNRRGGGAGGLSQTLAQLKAGDVVSYTVGAGGASVQNVNGNAGGATTVTIPGYTSLTANGGAGGSTTGASVGGTASGGNIMNVQGGSAGDFSYSGGGAVGVYGVTPAASATSYGAGVGEPYDSGGTSTGGSAIPGLTNVSTFLGRLLCPAGIGGLYTDKNLITASGSPGGGGAIYITTGVGGAGGMFAGGGQGADYSGGMGGSFGGGGGPTSGISVNSGKGGTGGVIIEFVSA